MAGDRVHRALTWLRARGLGLAAWLAIMLLALSAAFALRAVLSIDVKTAPSATVIAGTIVASGTVMTAVVALIGLVLRSSIDKRTTRLAEAADLRAVEEQRRQQMEAAIETVKLLAPPEVASHPPVQASAALIVLSRLGETSLALDLAGELWPQGGITSSSVVSLCDAAFRGDDADAQVTAAALLRSNWRLLRVDEAGQHYKWPASLIHGWPPGMAPRSKQLVKEALELWLEAEPDETHRDFRSLLLKRDR